jgi:FkbM family methyltransferase
MKVPYLIDKIRGKNISEIDVSGNKLKLYTETPYHHHIARGLRKKTYEKQAIEEWINEAKQKKCILDIGGYNGFYGLSAGIMNPEAKVFIFEPDQINAKHIRENIKINKLNNVSLIELAVSNKEGYVIFGGHNGGTGGRIGAGNRKIETITLDKFVEKEKCHPDLIKIDVEGAEMEVFEGGQEVWKNATQGLTIMLEVHIILLKKHFGRSEAELMELIKKMDNLKFEKMDDNNGVTYHVKIKKT